MRQAIDATENARMTSQIVLNLDGHTDVPRGKMATAVTHLQMLSRPALRPDPPGTDGLALDPIARRDVERYLSIYRTLGERWMWFSRLVMPREELASIMADPLTEAFAVTRGGSDCGLLELDWREAGACEIAFFGLYEEQTGGGAGRWLMNRALEKAWGRPGVARVWVHTCTFDDPRAVPFYRRSGFTPFLTTLEVCDDPRLDGRMRPDAAPHVPMIGR
jgi:GNAT superfamily N-acetyltransferase